MKVLTKALAATVVSGALLAGGATAAQAVVVAREGGTWDYAPGHSDYYHSARTHKSTVCDQGCVYAGWTAPGSWARARVAPALMGNTAYYDVK
ncbi:lactococcin 972 family bacteriocin [Leifsonia sp. L25]|uniref:lactococcin 972 family bacteriocin n=1 Tax=Actinomycetes TaxID=1760 RepID=UPI003D69B9B7